MKLCLNNFAMNPLLKRVKASVAIAKRAKNQSPNALTTALCVATVSSKWTTTVRGSPTVSAI
jgi:hypothetical protein